LDFFKVICSTGDESIKKSSLTPAMHCMACFAKDLAGGGGILGEGGNVPAPACRGKRECSYKKKKMWNPENENKMRGQAKRTTRVDCVKRNVCW
jgi:hypothetical protein